MTVFVRRLLRPVVADKGLNKIGYPWFSQILLKSDLRFLNAANFNKAWCLKETPPIICHNFFAIVEHVKIQPLSSSK